jgi:Caspase recruitment domain
METVWDNAILKEVFRELHAEIVKAVDAMHLIDNLVAKKIVTIDESNRITHLSGKEMRCRNLMSLAQSSGNRETFVTIMKSLKECEVSYDWLVEMIEQEYIGLKMRESKNKVTRVSHSASCSEFERQSSIAKGRADGLPSVAGSANKPDHRRMNSFPQERSIGQTSGIEITPLTNLPANARHTIANSSTSTTEQVPFSVNYNRLHL